MIRPVKSSALWWCILFSMGTAAFATDDAVARHFSRSTTSSSHRRELGKVPTCPSYLMPCQRSCQTITSLATTTCTTIAMRKHRLLNGSCREYCVSQTATSKISMLSLMGFQCGYCPTAHYQPDKLEWPELMNTPADYASSVILEERNYEVYTKIVPPGDTGKQDYIEYRVVIYTDENNTVLIAPTVG